MRKFSLKWTVVLGLGLIMVSCVSCTSINQAYWDSKIEEMCNKDAGVVVYERVGMNKIEYDEFRLLAINNKDENQNYYSILNIINIKNDGNILVRKYEEEAVRKKDGKILGRTISYSRVGGDGVFHWSHPTQFSCRNIGLKPNLRTSVFYIKE